MATPNFKKIASATTSPVSNTKRTEVTVKIKRNIFLTFDDGIQAGTEEVLALLKAKGVKATFFLTAVHVQYFIEKSKDRAKALAVLKDIYENHAIGNHSYLHANDFYANAYKDGIKVKGDGKKSEDKMSILDDFKMAHQVIEKYLGEMYGTKNIPFNKLLQAKNQKKAVARFPGRNTWYTKKIQDIHSSNSYDTKDEAKQLFDLGYEIFGWDAEWRMEFEFVEFATDYVNEKLSIGKMNFSDLEEAHPYFEMYAPENIGKDRLIDTWENVRDELLDLVYDGGLWDAIGKENEKVILLMHERAFRKGRKYKGKIDYEDSYYVDQLGKLIDYFLKIRSDFKTVDEY